MPNGHGFSFPLGVPIVVYPVLAVLTSSDKWWATIFAVIAVLLAAVFTWEAMSRKEFETIRAKDPTMNIRTWRFNWLAFFALPGYAIALFALWKRFG